jgi:hypothetical protein
MKNTPENLDLEQLKPPPAESGVPGIELAVKEIRIAFPDLSEESLARILGLPSLKAASPSASGGKSSR